MRDKKKGRKGKVWFEPAVMGRKGSERNGFVQFEAWSDL
jgi:hypothetical protein